jgi:hypothetical protein
MTGAEDDLSWGVGINDGAYDQAVTIVNRGLRPHFVYFMLAEAEPFQPLVKIGTTTDVNARMTQVGRQLRKGPDWLQDFPADAFTLMGFVIGDRELEQQLHRAFADHTAGREWFVFPPIEAAIDMFLSDHCVCPLCLTADRLNAVQEGRAA